MDPAPERREYTRIDLSMEARVDADHQTSWGRILNISELGAFATMDTAPQVGASVTLSFHHPIRRKPAAMEARVARVLPRGPDGRLGVGFALRSGMTARAVNRRGGERLRSSIPAELRGSLQRAIVTIVDVSHEGAALTCRAPLDPGPARISFRHPITRTVCVGRLIVLPSPRVGRDGLWRHGARLIDTLPDLARDPERGRGLLPLASVSGTWFEASLDQIDTLELSTQGLKRQVVWDASGLIGTGRLVLASPDGVLVAGIAPPSEGTRMHMLLKRTEGSTAPALRISVLVEQSGAHLIGGQEPGFLGAILGFPFQVDRENFGELTQWLAGRGAAGP